MSRSTRCRAKGGAANCTSPNCPEKQDVFNGPALGTFGQPTGMPFYDLVETPHFRQITKDAVEKALAAYDDEEQAWETIGYATSLVRDAYPAGSQALHMMDHNTGVLASVVRDAVYNVAEIRGIW